MRKWLLALLGMIILMAGCQSLKYFTVGFYDPSSPDSTAVAEEDST